MTYQIKIHPTYRPLVREAVERGWTLSVGGRHPKLTAPDGYATPVPSSDQPDLFKRWRKRLLSHPTFTEPGGG